MKIEKYINDDNCPKKLQVIYIRIRKLNSNILELTSQIKTKNKTYNKKDVERISIAIEKIKSGIKLIADGTNNLLP